MATRWCGPTSTPTATAATRCGTASRCRPGKTLVEQYQAATLLLAYVGGMAMLMTPCRFPVVLGIVPLCKGGRPVRGIVLALLFGAGLTITQTLWGVVIAAVGEMFGLREVARYLSVAGGVAAYLFGLSMLGLVALPMPTGTAWMPSGLRNRSEYLGAL